MNTLKTIYHKRFDGAIIQGMTKDECKNGGASLDINYSYAGSPFGNIVVASTLKGICYMGFADNEKSAFQQLKNDFPNAKYKQMFDSIQQNALHIFSPWHTVHLSSARKANSLDRKKMSQIKLHLKGTEFQLKVWNTLLKIPFGQLSSYGNIASLIGKPKASRAVGSAVGANPVAFFIPCHRVIQSTGAIGQYHWGSARKTAMIAWEAAQVNSSL